MDKQQMAKILKVAKVLEGKLGEGSIYSLGSAKANLGVQRWSTYIDDLDSILGGGLPKGRIVEIFGPESVGKTSLAYHLCSLHPICLFIPSEGTFDPPRARVFGNKPKQMLVFRDCRYAEDIMNAMFKFGEAGIPLIVVDSVPSMTPKSLYETTVKETDKQPQRGQLASLLSRTLKPLEDIIERSGTTVIFLNQVRDKMQQVMFGDNFTTPGGRALKHACSVRIGLGRRAWIEVPNKNPAMTSKQEKVGLITKVKVAKSKVCNPMGECQIPMFFRTGYCSHDDIQKIRKQIMQENNEKYLKRKR